MPNLSSRYWHLTVARKELFSDFDNLMDLKWVKRIRELRLIILLGLRCQNYEIKNQRQNARENMWQRLVQ